MNALRQIWTKPWSRWLAGVLLAVLLYALLLGVVVPKLIESKGPGWFAEQFHGELALGEVSFNPFTWEANLAQLGIKDPTGEEALGFEHLYVNLAPLGSLFSGEWQIQALSLDQPRVHMVGQTIEDNNLSALFAPRNPAPEEPKVEAEPAPLPPLVMEEVAVTDGWVHLQNTDGRQLAFSDWDLTSPRIALRGEDNVMNLLLEAEKGGIFRLEAHAAFEPLKFTIDLDIDALQLAQYWPFVADQLRFNLDQGQVDGKLVMTLDADDGLLLKPSTVQVSQLALSLEQNPLLTIDEIALDGLAARMRQQELELEQLKISSPELFATLTESGLDLQNLTNDDGGAGQKPAPDLDTPEKAGTAAASEDEPGSPGEADNPATEVAAREAALPAETVAEAEAQAAMDDQSSEVSGKAVAKLEPEAVEASAQTAPVEPEVPPVTGTEQPDAQVSSKNEEVVQTESADAGEGPAPVASAEANVESAPDDEAAVAETAPDKPPQVASEQAVEAETDLGSSWSVLVKELALDQGTINLADQTLSEPIDWQLLLHKIQVSGFTWPASQPFNNLLEASINEVVDIKVNGDWDLASMQGELDVAVDELDLTATTPYWKELVPLDLVSGWVTVKGKVAPDLSASPAAVRFDGMASSRELLIRDRRISEDLLAWQSLNIAPIVADSGAREVSIETVSLDQAFARIVIAEDGHSNLSDLTGGEGDDGTAANDSEPAANSESEAAPNDGEASAAPWNVAVSAIEFTDSAAFFADNTLTPKFATGIEAINGAIRGLSSDSSALAEVDIAGSVDQYAPVSLKGQVQPLAESPALDLSLTFDSLELTSLNAYSGTYAGYFIEQGLLNLDLNYKLADNQLQGSNHVVMDQLTLGARSDSDKATSLPVALAVALMKDSNGVIDLGLDVSGDLSDPEFAIGPLIGKALFNVITKVVTSPFSLLASLVPGEEPPQSVQFAAGSNEVAPAQVARLDSLVQGLGQRPGLILQLKGGVDPASDGDALKRDRLKARLQLDGSDDFNRLKAAYEAEFGAGTVDTLVAESDEAAATNTMLQQLLEQETLPDSVLAELASKRAEAVKAALVEAGLEADRAFLQESRIELDKSGRAVTLNLDARS